MLVLYTTQTNTPAILNTDVVFIVSTHPSWASLTSAAGQYTELSVKWVVSPATRFLHVKPLLQGRLFNVSRQISCRTCVGVI